MIPATYPSQLDENNTTQMVVYYLSNVSGLERWKDYIPVKETPLASPELNSFNTNGAIYTTALSSIVGKQAWVDYIPVYEDSLATDAWTINAVGYLTTKSEVVAKALAVIASYGTDAHVYLPGIGVINGLTAGNYLDSAGTTAATVDNPVGLVLDGAGSVGSNVRSLGVVGKVGTLAADATYNSTTGALSVSRVSFPNEQSYIEFSGLLPSTYYEFKFSLPQTNNLVLRGGIYSEGVVVVPVLSPGTYFILSSAAGKITITAQANSTSTFILDSVKSVTGIHATQGTTANKPILRRGAVNLVLNSIWAGGTSGTVGSGAVAPTSWAFLSAGGSVTYANQTIKFVGGGGRPAIFYTQTVLASCTYTMQITINTVTTGTPTIASLFVPANPPAGTTFAYYKNGVLGTSNTVVSTGDVIYIVATISTTAGTIQWRVGCGSSAVSNDDVTISKPQIEVGSTASTYIPTTTAAASSTTGNYAWEFDGSNDSLALGSVPFQMADDHCVIVGATPLSGNNFLFSIAGSGVNLPRVATVAVLANGKPSFQWKDDAANANGGAGASSILNQPSVLSARHASGKLSGRLNGVDLVAPVNNTLGVTTLTGGNIGMFGVAAGGGNANANFAVVINIKGTVTDADLLILEKWVGQLSGVSL